VPRKPNPVPKYSLHKPTGQARVQYRGKTVYLGVYNSPESFARYAELVKELSAKPPEPKAAPAPPKPPKSPIVSDLVRLHRRYLEEKYRRREGEARTSRKSQSERVLSALVERHGPEKAESFGPARLAAFRAWMVEQGWTRGYVKRSVRDVIACWKWAAGLAELVSAECANKLALFPMLGPGESEAPESEPILPAPERSVAAVLAQPNPVLRAMVELQLLTGMRPGELCQLRPGDIDRSGKIPTPEGGSVEIPGVWLYQPREHKTEHLGYGRFVLIGPRGQEVLAPFLDRDPESYCFSPAESAAAWMANRRSRRVTPLYPSHEARTRGLGREYGQRFTAKTYAQSIGYALLRAERARMAAERSLPEAERSPPIEHWHPHQLRHNAATRVTAEFGPEIARIVLGHRSLGVTRRYVADDLRKAAEAMKRAG
jgi:integrase